MILRAPFYVVAHSNMPAVLLEIAFITNKVEEGKLREDYFRNKVAAAICQGVEDFISATGETIRQDALSEKNEVTEEYNHIMEEKDKPATIAL